MDKMVLVIGSIVAIGLGFIFYKEDAQGWCQTWFILLIMSAAIAVKEWRG